MSGDVQPAGTSAKSPLGVAKVLFPRRSRRIRETNGSDSDTREEPSREVILQSRYTYCSSKFNYLNF